MTAAAGLGRAASLGCAVGDFDNDGRRTCSSSGPTGVRLLRNADGKRFEDMSADAGFDKLTGLFLGSAWVDLDQDGDLDPSSPGTPTPPRAAVVLVNVGEAPPVRPGEPPSR